MTFFLIIYDRVHGKAVVRAFADEKLALRELRLSESAKTSDTDVVLLIGDSEDDIRVTHSRYFTPAAQLVSEASADLEKARRLAGTV